MVQLVRQLYNVACDRTNETNMMTQRQCEPVSAVTTQPANTPPSLGLLTEVEHRQLHCVPTSGVAKSRTERLQTQLSAPGREELCLSPTSMLSISNYEHHVVTEASLKYPFLYDSVKRTGKGHAQQNIPDSRRLQSTELSALAAEMNLATKPRLLSIESSFGTSPSKSDSRVSWSFAFASVVCLRRLKSGPRYRHVLRRGHVRISKPLFIEKMGRAKASPSVTIQCAARRWLACIEMHNQAKLRTLQARREHCSLIQLIRVRQMAVDTAQKTARNIMSRSSAQQHSEYTNALAILQYYARGRVGNLTLTKLRQGSLILMSTVLLIQCHWRRKQSYKSAGIARVTALSMKLTQFVQGRSLGQRKNFQTHGAVVSLQKYWRKRAQMRQLRFKHDYLRELSANVIRGCILRLISRTQRRHRRLADRTVR